MARLSDPLTLIRIRLQLFTSMQIRILPSLLNVMYCVRVSLWTVKIFLALPVGVRLRLELGGEYRV